jgi:hypothetical protein
MRSKRPQVNNAITHAESVVAGRDIAKNTITRIYGKEDRNHSLKHSLKHQLRHSFKHSSIYSPIHYPIPLQYPLIRSGVFDLLVEIFSHLVRKSISFRLLLEETAIDLTASG